SASGSLPPWQHPFSYRYDDLYRDDVARGPRVDALSRMAADACEIPSPSTRSLGDFFVNRGNIYAICPGSVARRWRVNHARDCLGTHAFRGHHESNARRTASSETCDDSLSRNGLGRSHFHTSARAGNSVVGAALVNCRRHRLHGRHFIFRERAAALCPFCLASVRARRNELSLCGRVYLRNLRSAARKVGQVCLRGGLIVMLPVEHNDPINAKILAVSEDKIEGFVREPFEEIASRSGVGVDVVMARIAAMLRARTIRR